MTITEYSSWTYITVLVLRHVSHNVSVAIYGLNNDEKTTKKFKVSIRTAIKQ